MYTDECFLELPNFVLEGLALAIENNVTVEECKCFCVDAVSRYGMDCLSIQYYYDSSTCLLNKENRYTILYGLIPDDQVDESGRLRHSARNDDDAQLFRLPLH